MAATRSGTESFEREPVALTERITSDGSSAWPVEPGRYRLIVARACPWANRSVIVRRLLGLEPVLSMGIAGPLHDERSWRFHNDPDNRDPVLGIEYLREAYEKADPGFDAGVTVPTVVEIATGKAVTNNFQDLTLDLSTQWRAYHREGAPDLYPEQHRAEIDEINELVYHDVNNGVYKAGFASTQSAYDAAVTALFARLDWLEARLAGQRYLVGEQLTEADIRLFPTLVRFDAVYVGHFKCNLRRLVDYPNLWGYARDLYQTPGIAATVNFDHIKRHYYMTHPQLNPSRIVPAGPLVDWEQPHQRA
jgi:putative glutathione S-transferase